MGQTQYLFSPGDAIKALIMNCLTEGQPMYRLPEFFRETDTESLFGEDINAEQLNDHRLGRALNSLSAAEPSTVLGTVLLEAAGREDPSPEVVHADTTPSPSRVNTTPTKMTQLTTSLRSLTVSVKITVQISNISTSASASTKSAFPSSDRSSTGVPPTKPGTPTSLGSFVSGSTLTNSLSTSPIALL